MGGKKNQCEFIIYLELLYKQMMNKSDPGSCRHIIITVTFPALFLSLDNFPQCLSPRLGHSYSLTRLRD